MKAEGWNQRRGVVRPVPVDMRVEVIQAQRRAVGVAVAFNWTGYGRDPVLYWRLVGGPSR